MQDQREPLPRPERGAEDAQRAVLAYVRRLRLRGLGSRIFRAVSYAAGALVGGLALAALAVGATAGMWTAVGAWALIAAATAVAFRLGLGNLDELRGARAAGRLSAYDRSLASRLRSAAELGMSPNGSASLVVAHAAQVHQQVAPVPVHAAAVSDRGARKAALAALALSAGSLWALTHWDAGRVGLYALSHPGARDDDGAPLAAWVAGLEADLTFPAHLARAPEHVSDPRSLRVPRGTHLRLVVSTRLPVARATLGLGTRSLPFRRLEDGRLGLEFNAEESGQLALRARAEEGTWWTDSTARTIDVIHDAAPHAVLQRPAADMRVEPSEEVLLEFHATDDHGIESLELAVRGPGASQRRLPLPRPTGHDDGTRRSWHGEYSLRAADFGAGPGSTLGIWVEARDADMHTGPNVGRSEIRTLTVGTAQDTPSEPVELLTRARDRSLNLLADRLESPVPNPIRAGRQRHRTLRGDTKRLTDLLDRIRRHYDESSEKNANSELIRAMARRVRSLLREEAALYRRNSSHRARQRADDDAIAELEGDVLWLTDLLGRARLSRAHDVLDDLDQLRTRMRQLLEELKQSDDPERSRALLAEIARARAKLAELAQRMQGVQTDVPSDFINRDALRAPREQGALAQLEKAARDGDLESASRALDELDQQLDAMRSGLSETGVAFAQSRFAPRNDAAQQTRAALEALREGQQQLTEKTEELSRKAAARSKPTPAQKRSAAQLARDARQLAQEVSKLPGGRLQSTLREAQERTAQRLRDTEAALGQGDLFEARRMAEQAREGARALSTETGYDARVQGGSRLERAASKARSQRRRVSEWADQLQAALPEADPELTQPERQRMRNDAPEQRQLSREGQQLADQLRQESGDDGLSSGIGRQLGPALDAMRRASEALDGEKLRDAATQQREALDRLSRLSEQLQRQNQATSGQGGRGSRRGGGAHARAEERMQIPDQGDDPRRAALRRRLLDARRARTPDGYRERIDRYYEEILR